MPLNNTVIALIVVGIAFEVRTAAGAEVSGGSEDGSGFAGLTSRGVEPYEMD